MFRQVKGLKCDGGRWISQNHYYKKTKKLIWDFNANAV